jgi:AraC-like DNA-binding protein
LGARAVAAAEGLATRTLLRRLAASGTSARSLVQRLRREKALRLLATPMSLEEVAQALALSGPISLARFCRREFGTTAGRLRAELVQQGTPPRGAFDVAPNVNGNGPREVTTIQRSLCDLS